MYIKTVRTTAGYVSQLVSFDEYTLYTTAAYPTQAEAIQAAQAQADKWKTPNLEVIEA